MSISDVKYVCLGGCGAKAVVYFGFIKHVLTYCPSFLKNLSGGVGSSSGSLCTLALLLGVDIDVACASCAHVTNLLEDFDVQGLLHSYGLNNGKRLREYICKQLMLFGLAPDSTFETLRRLTGKDFRVCATNLRSRSPVLFSAISTPNMSLRDAIYMSMCIPFLFQPHAIDEDLYADGGLVRNVPFGVFPERETLVLCLQDVDFPVLSLQQYAMSVVYCTFSSQYESFREYSLQNSSLTFEIPCAEESDTLSMSLDTRRIDSFFRIGYAHSLSRSSVDLLDVVAQVTFLLLRARLLTR